MEVSDSHRPASISTPSKGEDVLFTLWRWIPTLWRSRNWTAVVVAVSVTGALVALAFLFPFMIASNVGVHGWTERVTYGLVAVFVLGAFVVPLGAALLFGVTDSPRHQSSGQRRGTIWALSVVLFVVGALAAVLVYMTVVGHEL